MPIIRGLRCYPKPNVPKLVGESNFGAPILHHYDFGQSSVLCSAKAQNVTVLGGSKSAADMILASVKAGKNVSWIIRRSGAGLGWFVSYKGKGPYKNVVEIGSTRFFSTFSPSVLGPENWLTQSLHGTRWGAMLIGAVCQAIWTIAYLDKQLTLPSLKNRQLEIARQVAWCRRRYLSHGVRGNFAPFESEAYTDKILAEIGLSSHRKGILRDTFMPTRPKDLAGLKDEYLNRFHPSVAEVGDTKSSGAPLLGGKSVIGSGWMYSLRDLLRLMFM
ncbi:MAG: hypothetical protein Q9226_006142 [Calogaya cf. arnoldii]